MLTADCGLRVEYIEASSWLGANNRDPPSRWPALGARSLM